MYIDTVPNRGSPPAILLREGWREGGTVKKRTLANLSKWPPAVVEGLRIYRTGSGPRRVYDALGIPHTPEEFAGGLGNRFSPKFQRFRGEFQA